MASPGVSPSDLKVIRLAIIMIFKVILPVFFPPRAVREGKSHKLRSGKVASMVDLSPAAWLYSIAGQQSQTPAHTVFRQVQGGTKNP
jgi:hypothetical protein